MNEPFQPGTQGPTQGGMQGMAYDGMGYPPGLMRQTTDFDKWRLDTETIADQLENQLKGFVWNDNEKTWVKGNFPPAVNEIGAAELSNIIRDLSNRITFLSELNDDNISKMCLDINRALVSTMFMNWDLWQVRKESARWITTKIMTIVFIGFNRAKGRGEAELMSQMTSINRNIFEGQQQSRGFSPMNLFRRNKGQQQGQGYRHD